MTWTPTLEFRWLEKRYNPNKAHALWYGADGVNHLRPTRVLQQKWISDLETVEWRDLEIVKEPRP